MLKNQKLLGILALAAILVVGLAAPAAQAGDITGVTNLLAANHWDEQNPPQLEMFNADTGDHMFTFDPLPDGLAPGTKATAFHDGYWYTFSTIDNVNLIAGIFRYDIDGTNPVKVAEMSGMVEGIAVSDDNHLYVGSSGGWGWVGGLYKFDMSTTPYTPVGQINSGNHQGTDVGPDGNVYTANTANGKISYFDPNGNGLGQIAQTRVWSLEFHPGGDLYSTSYDSYESVAHYNSPLHPTDPLALVEEIPVPDFGGWNGIGKIHFLGEDTMFVSRIGQGIARYLNDGGGWTLDPETEFVARPDVQVPRTWSFAVGSAPVPEPSSIALLVCGLLGLAFVSWRKRWSR